MNEQQAIHITRNPWGHSMQDRRGAHLHLADLVEQYRDAYLNMRAWAEQNGLDTATRGDATSRAE